MYPPAGRPVYRAYVLGNDKGRQNVADPAHQVAADVPRIIGFDETPDAAMFDAADDHR